MAGALVGDADGQSEVGDGDDDNDGHGDEEENLVMESCVCGLTHMVFPRLLMDPC